MLKVDIIIDLWRFTDIGCTTLRLESVNVFAFITFDNGTLICSGFRVISSHGFAGFAGFGAYTLGHEHTVVLRPSGTVWTTGANNYGQLGNQNTQSTLMFSMVKDNAKDVAAGYYHTVVLDQDNKVWTAGLHQQPINHTSNQSIS